MNCAYCDAVIPDGVEVCPECGNSIDKTGLLCPNNQSTEKIFQHLREVFNN